MTQIISTFSNLQDDEMSTFSSREKELLARFDDRTLETISSVGKLAAEVGELTKRFNLLEAELLRDMRDIKISVRRGTRKVRELSEDVEDTGKFVISQKLQQKLKRKRIAKIVMAFFISGAALFGAAAAGSAWKNCTGQSLPEGHIK